MILRREAKADRRLVAGGRIDAGDPHQRPQAGLLGLGEAPQARERERAALVDERHDVGDRRERDDVEVAVEEGVTGAEQRLGELPHDRRAAQPRERVVALERRDDGAIGELAGGPVVVRDDDVETEPAGLGDLGDRGDAAVDREHELDAVLGKPGDRLRGKAVALLEPRRQMPDGLGAELAEQEDGEGGRADPVGVVVAVNGDPPAGGDGRADRLDRLAHVPERERVVARERSLEERAGRGRDRRTRGGRARRRASS